MPLLFRYMPRPPPPDAHGVRTSCARGVVLGLVNVWRPKKRRKTVYSPGNRILHHALGRLRKARNHALMHFEMASRVIDL